MAHYTNCFLLHVLLIIDIQCPHQRPKAMELSSLGLELPEDEPNKPFLFIKNCLRYFALEMES
jgi:hypothetical protein